MLPKIPPQTLYQVLTVAAVVIVNVLLSSFVWRLAGSKRRRWRGLGRGVAALVGIANLGLGMVCLMRMLRYGPDWLWTLLLLIAFVFAYRVGGATREQLP